MLRAGRRHIRSTISAQGRRTPHWRWDASRWEYLARKNNLLIERNQLEAQQAAASIALQRQRLQSVVDDWSAMNDEEKKRVLQMIFSEIRADHTVDGLKIEFRPKPIWEPYVEAVLAGQKQEQDALTTVTTSERKTGLYIRDVETPQLVRDERGWLRLAG